MVVQKRDVEFQKPNGRPIEAFLRVGTFSSVPVMDAPFMHGKFETFLNRSIGHFVSQF